MELQNKRRINDHHYMRDHNYTQHVILKVVQKMWRKVDL